MYPQEKVSNCDIFPIYDLSREFCEEKLIIILYKVSSQRRLKFVIFEHIYVRFKRNWAEEILYKAKPCALLFRSSLFQPQFGGRFIVYNARPSDFFTFLSHNLNVRTHFLFPKQFTVKQFLSIIFFFSAHYNFDLFINI